MSRVVRRILALALAGAVLTAVPVFASAEPLGPMASVEPKLETPPLFDDDDGGGGDADDPAIWVKRDDRVNSLVIGTAKDAGLFVYDLDGDQVQHIAPPPPPAVDDAPGRFNNVDVAYNIDLGGSGGRGGRDRPRLGQAQDLLDRPDGGARRRPADRRHRRGGTVRLLR